MKLKNGSRSEAFKHSRRQFLRFAFVGVLNTVIDFSVFTFLFRVAHAHYALCQVFGFSAGVVNSFLWNKHWTFAVKRINASGDVRRKHKAVQFLQFVVINLITLGVTEIGLLISIDHAHIPVLTAKLMIIAFAQAINFFGYKLWVFTPPRPVQ